MNDRINELAKQAGCGWWEGQASRDMTRCQVELEKFAELIIRDCMSICDDVQLQFGQYTFTARISKERMQEHFGVKE